MARLKDKTALITGAASGLGAAMAALFVREGAHVAVTDISEAEGRATANRLGAAAAFWRLDVTDEQQWETVMAEVLRRFGKLDVVVNNAGISEPANVEDETLAHWRRTMAINADSVFLGTKHGVRAMKDTGGGSIINISSALGIKAGSVYAAYCASKAAVRLLTKAAALHCAERHYNIRCNTIHPGAIRTPMMERYLEAAADPDAAYRAFAAAHPLGRVGEPDDIAYAALYLASDEAKFVTGEELCVDGGLAM